MTIIIKFVSSHSMIMGWRNLKYALSLFPGVITFYGISLGGYWTYGNFIFSLGLLPLIEMVLPEDTDNKFNQQDIIPDMILGAHVLMQVLIMSILFHSIANDRFNQFELIGAVLSVGLHSGSGAIVVAHELIHRKNAFWQSMGKLLLFSAGNFYFFIEHLKVHHKWVGTSNDPATALRGESLYRFFIRSVVGQLSGAWKIEASRMKQSGYSVFSFRNYVFTSILLTTLLLIFLAVEAGWIAVSFFMVQALLANFLLEYTNYIEHYGLQRDPKERTTEIHSWQSDKIVSRFILIDLSRHADHHYYASKPYHRLDSYENSPVLPAGYTSSFYLALVPSLWFRIMDNRLDQFHSQ